MTLLPDESEQLYNALLSAFPRRADFERLAWHGLGENLFDIVRDGTRKEISFDLIRWAQSQDRIADLVAAAVAQNSRNPELHAFARHVGLTTLQQPPAAVDAGEDFATRVQRVKAVFSDPPAPLPAPARGKTGILIDLSHGQKEWESPLFRGEVADLLRLLGAAPESAPWDLHRIQRTVQLKAAGLKQWSGLILGLPYHIRIEEETHYELVKWVRQGGRLVLLGFELGERHHETNVNELAGEFGIRFNSDIVAPQGWNTQFKPYDEPIDFAINQPPQPPQPPPTAVPGALHLFDGVSRLRLWNLCTLTVEPGADFLLTLGEHAIGWLQKEGVSYSRRGMLRTWNQRFTVFSQANWMPVIAAAPKALTGKGSVLAIGTWQLFTRQAGFPAGFDNQRLVANLLDWCRTPST